MPPAVAKPVVAAIQAGRVAAQPAEAGAEEEPPGMDTQRLAFAAWPDHNWCKMLHRRRVASHISDKTFFCPKLPACLKSTHRTGACYSTRNQRVNMQMPPPDSRSTRIRIIVVATATPFSSWDLNVRGIFPPMIDDRRGAIRHRNGSTMRIRENINRSCTVRAPSLRLVRPME